MRNTHFRISQAFRVLGIAILLAVTAIGCVSQKPLPFNYSALKAAPESAPSLDVRPTESQRFAKDKMDKVVDLPDGLNHIILRELKNSGLFRNVEMKVPSTSTTNYSLQATLKELRWNVPNYKQELATTTTISALTGGIGGLAYGSTGIDVHGIARVQFVLKNQRGGTVLNREYSSTFTERKSKMNCDTPATYREVAAGALKEVLNQFTRDVQQLNLQ
jgi:hypothetical protein